MTLQPLFVDGAWQPAIAPAGQFRAEDPSTGEPIGSYFPISSAADIEAALSAAVTAATSLAAAAPEAIADFLDRYASAIESDAQALCDIAHAETGLPTATRLAKVELPRTCNQLRLAAHAVRQYSWTRPVIDTAAGLRSHFAPLGKPVLIFGPNNFPFAFNAIAGSDFASAIAARNPVLAKAHPSHPATCERLAHLAQQALHESGLPRAAVQLLYHFDNHLGLTLAGDNRLGAIAFTGSRQGGLALKAAADRAGVPAYMEMSSVNPVFILPGALAERGEALVREFFTSCTMGSGQFCTNPGIVVLPAGKASDDFAAAATALFASSAPHLLFSRAVLDHLQQGVATLRQAGAACLAGGASSGPGHRHLATLLSVDAQQFLHNPQVLQSEAFGPVSLLVRASAPTDLAALAASFDGNLTGTFYTAIDGSDDALLAQLMPVLRTRVGRLIINRMPTGVAVSAAMNHGGPYPSTGHPGFTAVGMPTAIHRFAALHCYDHVPDNLLPTELRDANPLGVARLIDGQWRTGDVIPVPEK